MAIIEMSIKDSPRSPKTDLVIHGNYSVSYNRQLIDSTGIAFNPLVTMTIEADRVTDITKLKEALHKGKTSPTKAMLNTLYGYAGEMFFDEFAFCNDYFEIKKVIFNGPATIVFFGDGKKEVVKRDPNSNESFDPQKAILYAFMKHFSKRESSKTWNNNLKMVDRGGY